MTKKELIDHLEAMRERLKWHKRGQRNALAEDDPKSNCAAHHRGAIDADEYALEMLNDILKG